MDGDAESLFDLDAWQPALAKYGAVVQMSVSLFDAQARLVCGPLPATPLVGLFDARGHVPTEWAECSRECLRQTADHRPPVVVTTACGLAVVGVSLLLDGQNVGALISGYAAVTFCESVGVARLARESGAHFSELWAAVRNLRPIPERRLIQHGELLQVLGDALLRENRLRRRSEEVAVQLTTVAAVKEGFLAVLSHELRTPLTPILGWASILKKQDDAKVVHAATVIERNAIFQLRMVEDLLELTRTMQGKLVLNLTVISLNEQVRAALEAVADGAAGKQIVPVFADAPEPLWINGDADRVQQVLRNILLNALKFTPAGGAINVTLTKAGDEGVLIVRDNGEGIPAEFLPLVFQMFQQQERGTRRAHPGLGIGLALVKQLAEAHGGSVTIGSDRVGRGAEVTVRWPLTALRAEPPAVQPVTDVLALDGIRILVVEDMDDSREAICAMLQRFGATAASARDGVEALEQAAGTGVDLILCDLRMPRMDGFEFLRVLNSIEGHTHPPVIAVSGLAGGADHLATQAAGFAGHLDKPFDDRRLLAAIRLAMTRQRTDVSRHQPSLAPTLM